MSSQFVSYIIDYEDALGFRHPMVGYRAINPVMYNIQVSMTDSPAPELTDDSDEPNFDDEDGFDEADFGWDEDDE